MTNTSNNPLIDKYNEIYKPKKEEPKSYDRQHFQIAKLEALLKDLKSGRAVMTDCKTRPNHNHLNVNPFDYFSSPSPSDFMPLPVDRGDLIHIEIFRKYV